MLPLQYEFVCVFFVSFEKFCVRFFFVLMFFVFFFLEFFFFCECAFLKMRVFLLLVTATTISLEHFYPQAHH
jgi:hypothetical protein